MGKSFNKSNKKQYSEHYERSNSDYKRRKNKLKEERANEEYSEYKYHGFKYDRDE